MPTSLEIADLIDAEHDGEVVEVTGVDDLGAATESDLAFCVYEDPEYVRSSDAGAIVCPRLMESAEGRTLLRVDDPKHGFWTAVDEFFRQWPTETEIHPTAVVSEGASIGNQCIIGPNVHIGEAVTIGDRCRVMAGTTIGDTGFGWIREDDLSHTRVKHSGSVLIEDNVDIGSNCSIDRGIFETNSTTIREGAKICNLVHIGHQVVVGENVELMQLVNISGNVDIEEGARINPAAAIANDTVIGAGADIGMNATVLDDVKPHTRVVGTPARTIREDVTWWDE
ncbi:MULTISPECIES: UDP-3-O-(3-hydroxymyristoyl)glucosamine N-acyltransferase [Salinibaculum]|uniref:UDP-3-O-(3-hydroxymyristoyl)glucosamine N-acyltransferase n=1 Tax=Salinibaculum TaxID=2732368 RepID=UPI0030CFBD6D